MASPSGGSPIVASPSGSSPNGAEIERAKSAETVSKFGSTLGRPWRVGGKYRKINPCLPLSHHLWIIWRNTGFPYSLPSVGPGADPGVQAVSPQVTISHPPGGSLPLLSARPAVTFPAAEHHRSLADTKLYCLATVVHRCEQFVQG